MPAITVPKRVWSWLLAYVGPLLAALFFGIWWLYAADTRLTMAEANQPCEDANTRAELAATREKLRIAQKTSRLRARAIEMAETEIQMLRKKLEDRAAARAPDTPVFAADGTSLHKQPR